MDTSYSDDLICVEGAVKPYATYLRGHFEAVYTSG